MVNWGYPGFTDRLFHATASDPSTTSYVVCETDYVGAVGRARPLGGGGGGGGGGGERAPSGGGGVKPARSLGQRVFTLMNVAPEMKSYEGFYNSHKWKSRGFFIYHPWLPAGLFMKKSVCYKFFHHPPNALGLVDLNKYIHVRLYIKGSGTLIIKEVLISKVVRFL